jgi:serine/threonine protein kinase
MWLMSAQEYNQLVEGATELERDRHGIKVLLTSENQIIKLIRIKRWLSFSVIYPYSLRFRRNAKRLTAMGIPCVQVERVFYCHAIKRHGLIYPLMEGESLEKISAREGLSDDLFEKLADFIALLHRKGIYFRSLHLGNILLLPQGGFGLIDVADMRFSKFPLRVDQRRRNFRHLLRNRDQRQLFTEYGLERFFDLYIQAAGLDAAQSGKIRSLTETI